MASYNGERFMAEQLATLVGQTLRPHEVIVCDDGSTDSTLDVVERFADRLPLRIYRNSRRLGVGDNFLSGVSRATGDVVAFCDQDDRWYPRKLERCVAEMVDDDVVVVFHTARLVDEDGISTGRLWPRIPVSRTLLPGELPLGLYGHGMAMVFRREVLYEVPAARRPMVLSPHDHWVAFVGSCRGHIKLIAEPLADYRIHGMNACGLFDPGAMVKVALARSATVQTYAVQRQRYLDRAEYLLGLAERWDRSEPTSASSARCLAHRQLKVALERQRRLRLYEARGGLSRIKAFGSVLASQAYRSRRSEGLGFRGLAKDTLQTVTGRVAASESGPALPAPSNE